MIPETITLPIGDIARAVWYFCPPFFQLGVLFGIYIVVSNIRRTGYRMIWKHVGRKRWPVMEKIVQ